MIFLTSPLVILACRVFVQHKSEQEYINDTPLHVYYCMRVAHTSRAPFFGTWPGGSLFSLPLEYFSEFSFSRFASRQLIPLVGAWVPNKLVVWVYRYHIFSVDLYFLQIARIQNSDLFYFVFLFRKFCYLPYLARTFVFAHKHTCALHATNIYACNLPGIAAHRSTSSQSRAGTKVLVQFHVRYRLHLSVYDVFFGKRWLFTNELLLAFLLVAQVTVLLCVAEVAVIAVIGIK